MEDREIISYTAVTGCSL